MHSRTLFWMGAIMALRTARLEWWFEMNPPPVTSDEFYVICVCTMLLGIGLRVLHGEER